MEGADDDDDEVMVKNSARPGKRIDDASSHIKHFMSVPLSKGTQNWRNKNKTKKSTDLKPFLRRELAGDLYLFSTTLSLL